MESGKKMVVEMKVTRKASETNKETEVRKVQGIKGIKAEILYCGGKTVENILVRVH